MKVISMYLPQFHRVKENDEWWGEGFTEWTIVKKAEKLHQNQYQPRIPLNDNYYDLLNRETMLWQTSLMKQYGIDGQCFYHYWFKDGKQILEKPALNLLQWKEIELPFCFCWANESWARTWSRIGDKNPWANTFEKEKERNGSGILLEQKYGEEEQWKRHFEYLLSFFKDDRYIKIENRPVFLIYKSSLIPCLKEMIHKWNKWAMDGGFAGIYVIGANSNQKVENCLDAVLYHEPQRTMTIMNYKKSDRTDILTLDYNEVWNELLSFCSDSEKAVYGGFVGYDDTPRRGKEGIIIENAEPDKFKIYLAELIAKNVANNKEFVFLNAWNEWGEGMYLEPDEKYRYGYLEAVKYAKEHYSSYVSKYRNESAGKNDALKIEMEFWKAKCAQYESYWKILDTWLYLKEESIALEKYFLERNVYSIAIYGMGILGKHLLKELETSKIEVAYAIDRKAEALHLGIEMYSPEAELPAVDAIVITATYAFFDIRSQLKKRGYENVISLEEIIIESIE